MIGKTFFMAGMNGGRIQHFLTNGGSLAVGKLEIGSTPEQAVEAYSMGYGGKPDYVYRVEVLDPQPKQETPKQAVNLLDIQTVRAAIEDVSRQIESISGDSLVNTLAKQIDSLLGTAAPAPEAPEETPKAESKPVGRKAKRRAAYDSIDRAVTIVKNHPSLNLADTISALDDSVAETLFATGDSLFDGAYGRWDTVRGEDAVKTLKQLKRALR